MALHDLCDPLIFEQLLEASAVQWQHRPLSGAVHTAPDEVRNEVAFEAVKSPVTPASFLVLLPHCSAEQDCLMFFPPTLRLLHPDL